MDMAKLPFNEDIVRSFAEFRMQPGMEWYTALFNLITNLGSEMGYIFLITTIYWVFSKKKAVRIAYAVVVSSLLNSVLKDIIQNPRPFVTSGENTQLWGTQAEGYSTPSGHAQISGTFWTTLALLVRKKWMVVLAIVAIFLVGISRPILGVHYVEDVVIGWVIGILLALLIHYLWERVSIPLPKSDLVFSLLLTAETLVLTIIIGVITSFGEGYTGYITVLGMFTGIAIGERLEKRIGFDSKAPSVINGLLRVVVGIVLVAVPLFGFDKIFELLAEDPTFLGYVLRWVRYSFVGLFAMGLAPWVFVKLSIANKEN